MKIQTKALLILTLAVCAGLTMTGRASACFQECVEIAPFCERCQNVGYLTGTVCRDIGSCACKWNYGVCAPIEVEADAGDPRVSLEDLGIIPESEPAQCSATAE